MTGIRTEQQPPPDAATGAEPGPIDERTWAAAIGPRRCAYYLPRFQRFESRGIVPTWHWPAFFVTFWWLVYRKLWLPALLYWAAWTAVTNLDTLLEDAGFPPVASLVALIVCFTFVPMYANALYYVATRRKILRIQARIPDPDGRLRALERAGGTSFLLFLGIALLVAAAAAAVIVPLHRDRVAREQLGEAIGMTYRFKTDLAGHHVATGTFEGIEPATPGYDTSGDHVQSITFLREGTAALAVVATFHPEGVEAPLRAREFRIATMDGGRTWECGTAISDPALRGNNQVDARLLPDQCR